MEEFQSVIAEIADLEAFEQWRSFRRETDEANSANVRLVTSVRTEMLNVSVLTAVTSGIANAMEQPSGIRVQAQLLAVYAPSHTSFFHQSVEPLLQSILPVEDGARLQSYLARLDLASRLTATFSAQGPFASKSPDPELLADAWRRTAADAVTVIEIMTDVLGRAVAQSRQDESTRARVQSLLRMAAAGNSPCLDTSGRISIPGWAERRHERRRSIDLPARATFGSHVQEVRIRDLSPTGLGLECSVAIPEDAFITLHINGDRCLTGRVVWSSEERAGIELSERLSAQDPLLATQ